MRCAPFAGVSTRRCEEGTGWGSQDDDGLRYRLGCIHVGSECRPKIYGVEGKIIGEKPERKKGRESEETTKREERRECSRMQRR